VVAEVVTVVETVLESDVEAVVVCVDDAVDDCDDDAELVAVVVAVVRQSNRGIYESTSFRAALFRCLALSSASVHCSSGGESFFCAIDDSAWYCC